MEITNSADSQGPYIGKTAGGEFFSLTDCSGFVSYVTSVADKDAYNEIWTYRPDVVDHLPYCPSAAQYANYVPRTNGHWTRVLGEKGEVDFSLILAGDIIAWDEDDTDPDGDTGHVMIAAGASTFDSASSYYQVEIFDSTLDQHMDDVRNGKKRGDDPSGVGFGIIGLQKDGSTLQSNFFPGVDSWFTHPHITILRYTPPISN